MPTITQWFQLQRSRVISHQLVQMKAANIAAISSLNAFFASNMSMRAPSKEAKTPPAKKKKVETPAISTGEYKHILRTFTPAKCLPDVHGSYAKAAKFGTELFLYGKEKFGTSAKTVSGFLKRQYGEVEKLPTSSAIYGRAARETKRKKSESEGVPHLSAVLQASDETGANADPDLATMDSSRIVSGIGTSIGTHVLGWKQFHTRARSTPCALLQK